ncbi:unnamed protein product [Amoebophrya sp. A25]|nr:unnamed protein product [Amoebophrya sp. A25]|eukprot:GSA25T00017014001.1
MTSSPLRSFVLFASLGLRIQNHFHVNADRSSSAQHAGGAFSSASSGHWKRYYYHHEVEGPLGREDAPVGRGRGRVVPRTSTSGGAAVFKTTTTLKQEREEEPELPSDHGPSDHGSGVENPRPRARLTSIDDEIPVVPDWMPQAWVAAAASSTPGTASRGRSSTVSKSSNRGGSTQQHINREVAPSPSTAASSRWNIRRGGGAFMAPKSRGRSSVRRTSAGGSAATRQRSTIFTSSRNGRGHRSFTHAYVELDDEEGRGRAGGVLEDERQKMMMNNLAVDVENIYDDDYDMQNQNDRPRGEQEDYLEKREDLSADEQDSSSAMSDLFSVEDDEKDEEPEVPRDRETSTAPTSSKMLMHGRQRSPSSTSKKSSNSKNTSPASDVVPRMHVLPKDLMGEQPGMLDSVRFFDIKVDPMKAFGWHMQESDAQNQARLFALIKRRERIAQNALLLRPEDQLLVVANDERVNVGSVLLGKATPPPEAEIAEISPDVVIVNAGLSRSTGSLVRNVPVPMQPRVGKNSQPRKLRHVYYRGTQLDALNQAALSRSRKHWMLPGKGSQSAEDAGGLVGGQMYDPSNDGRNGNIAASGLYDFAFDGMRAKHLEGVSQRSTDAQAQNWHNYQLANQIHLGGDFQNTIKSTTRLSSCEGDDFAVRSFCYQCDELEDRMTRCNDDRQQKAAEPEAAAHEIPPERIAGASPEIRQGRDTDLQFYLLDTSGDPRTELKAPPAELLLGGEQIDSVAAKWAKLHHTDRDLMLAYSVLSVNPVVAAPKSGSSVASVSYRLKHIGVRSDTAASTGMWSRVVGSSYAYDSELSQSMLEQAQPYYDKDQPFASWPTFLQRLMRPGCPTRNKSSAPAVGQQKQLSRSTSGQTNMRMAQLPGGRGGQQAQVPASPTSNDHQQQEADSSLNRYLSFPLRTCEWRQVPVYVNVYDLDPPSWESNKIPFWNRVFTNDVLKVGGLFHAGIEVYNREFSFGYTPRGSGVETHTPRNHHTHAYRESVLLGFSYLSLEELSHLVSVKQRQWPGASYDLLERNCCTFSDEFAQLLGVGSIPQWIHRFARWGSSLAYAANQFPHLMSSTTGGSNQPDGFTGSQGHYLTPRAIASAEPETLNSFGVSTRSAIMGEHEHEDHIGSHEEELRGPSKLGLTLEEPDHDDRDFWKLGEEGI